MKEPTKRQLFLLDRIERLDLCIHEIESTALNYYDPKGKEMENWNTLLKSKDIIVVIRDSDWLEWEEIESNK